MDTPRPEQVREVQPEAQEPTDEDSLELMEMILGALGKDAVGLGARWDTFQALDGPAWVGPSLGFLSNLTWYSQPRVVDKCTRTFVHGYTTWAYFSSDCSFSTQAKHTTPTYIHNMPISSARAIHVRVRSGRTWTWSSAMPSLPPFGG